MRSSWLIVGILCSGCATGPQPIAPLDTFAKLEVSRAAAIEPVEVPPRPRAHALEVDGAEYVGFTPDGMEQLQARDEAQRTNVEILRDAIAAFEASEDERLHLIRMGQLTEQRANRLAERLYLTQTEMARRSTEHLVETWLHRAFILGLMALRFSGF